MRFPLSRLRERVDANEVSGRERAISAQFPLPPHSLRSFGTLSRKREKD
jgi:hypothetical protein